ncbi:mCG53437, isoform CRA_a, partial [Mus musculus]
CACSSPRLRRGPWRQARAASEPQVCLRASVSLLSPVINSLSVDSDHLILRT